VQITYDVDIGGERQRRELPFVIGVLGEFSGTADARLPKLRERKFVSVGRENFDTVMRALEPRLAMTVPNRLADDGSKLAVELRFDSLDDFEPDRVVRQVDPLRRLIEVREKLTGLLRRVQRDGGVQQGLEAGLRGTSRAATGAPSRR
jgi:type VI secretion system protein ImpB